MKYSSFLFGGELIMEVWYFPFIRVLWHQPFEGVDRAPVLGPCQWGIITGRVVLLGLPLNPILSLIFGLVFWACTPIVLDPISCPPALG